MEGSILFKKVYGCILGFCIGDAMGGPVEGMPVKELVEKHGRLTTFVGYDRKKVEKGMDGSLFGGYSLRTEPGVYTDDGRNSLMWIQAVIRKGGRVDLHDVTDAFNEARFDDSMIPQGPEKKWAYNCYQAGLRGHYPGWNFSAMALGMINACNPEQAALDTGANWTVVNHGDGFCAAAIAEAFKPDSTIDSVVQAALRYGDIAIMKEGDILSKVGAIGMKKAIIKCIGMAKECKDIWELRDRYDWHRGHWAAFGAGFMSMAFGMFYRANGDPKEAIIGGVNSGDDTIPHFAGGIAGAFKGVDAIPQDWINTVEKANPIPNLRQTAEKMCEVIKKRSAEIKEQRDRLQLQLESLGSIV